MGGDAVSHHPYPRADRALRQIWRHPSRRAAAQARCVVTITADTGGLVNAMRRVENAIVFGWHPDLRNLDDELNALYRGQL